MRRSVKLMELTLSLMFMCALAPGQDHYNDFKSMSQKISKLASDYPSLCKVRSVVKTAGGKNIWVISIGTGETDKKPAIAVIGGIEGSYLLGTEIALGFAENILRQSTETEIKNLLGKISFYVIPNVCPDATEQYFSALRYERKVNTAKTDEDRDFTFDEDPCEDLNNDGIITTVRISDPAGTYISSEDDERVMVPADLSKGQKGSFIVYSEGIDNDKDGLFNEDGPGGVNFNRNFTFNYEEFGANAGLHAVSEPETRAIADFLYDHFNIFATFAFGPQDNLSQPIKTAEKPVSSDQANSPAAGRILGDRRITSIMKTDETVNKLVSDKYHGISGLKGSPPAKQAPGNFMDWAYFHYGRYSFSTPGWWVTSEKSENTDAAFIKYAEENKFPEVFVPWTEIKHPDFPGKKVEVGGIKPFVMTNPPAEELGEIVTKNYQFLLAAAALHPELEFLDAKTENAGENIFRIFLKVLNKGTFATCAEIGDFNQWTKIMRITIEPSKNQTILSGLKIQRISRLEGGKAAEFTWLVSGKGTVNITAGAINTGTISTTLDLK